MCQLVLLHSHHFQPQLSTSLSDMHGLTSHLTTRIRPSMPLQTMNVTNSTAFCRPRWSVTASRKPFLIPTHSSKVPAWLGSPLLLAHIILCQSWSPALTTGAKSHLMLVPPLHPDLWGWRIYSPLYPRHPSNLGRGSHSATDWKFTDLSSLHRFQAILKWTLDQESQDIWPLPISDLKLPTSATCITYLCP